MKKRRATFWSLALGLGVLFGIAIEFPHVFFHLDYSDSNQGNRSHARSSSQNSGIRLEFSTKRDFYDWTLEIMHRLPRIEEVKSHRKSQISSDIVVAASKISEVSKIIREYPELKPIGVQFLNHCANNNEVVSAVRGLCTIRLQSTHSDLGGSHTR